MRAALRSLAAPLSWSAFSSTSALITSTRGTGCCLCSLTQYYEYRPVAKLLRATQLKSNPERVPVSWMWLAGGDHRLEPPPSSAISVKLRTPRLQLRYGDDDVNRALDAGVTTLQHACRWSHVFSKHVIRTRLNGYNLYSYPEGDSTSRAINRIMQPY
jgi:hypothetical protein